jgi:hypothetical protein
MSTKLYDQIYSPHQSKHSLRVKAFPEESRLLLWLAHCPSNSHTFIGFPSCFVDKFTAGVETRGARWMGKDSKGDGRVLVEGWARCLRKFIRDISVLIEIRTDRLPNGRLERDHYASALGSFPYFYFNNSHIAIGTLSLCLTKQALRHEDIWIYNKQGKQLNEVLFDLRDTIFDVLYNYHANQCKRTTLQKDSTLYTPLTPQDVKHKHSNHNFSPTRTSTPDTSTTTSTQVRGKSTYHNEIQVQ